MTHFTGLPTPRRAFSGWNPLNRALMSRTAIGEGTQRTGGGPGKGFLPGTLGSHLEAPSAVCSLWRMGRQELVLGGELLFERPKLNGNGPAVPLRRLGETAST